jgi:predicted dinucleotide-binding enzyme
MDSPQERTPTIAGEAAGSGQRGRTIAVVGGTGQQGRGLAYRFALAGDHVILGSREAARARETAGEINARLPEPRVFGDTNAGAVSRSDLVLLAVPWEGHAAWWLRSPTNSRRRS